VVNSQLTPAANINVKNFHRSLTTVVRAQNDTSETANITDTIFNKQKVILLLQLSTFRRFAAKYYHLFLLPISALPKYLQFCYISVADNWYRVRGTEYVIPRIFEMLL